MPMRRTVALAAIAVSAVLLAVGCGDSSRESAPTARTFETGGTLKLAGPAWPDAFDPAGARLGFDPGTWEPGIWELARCCLVRTLLSYNGRPTAEGGAKLRPDLAASLPTISRDGRTWTFHLRRGLHYAPPLEGTEIVAQDFIRSLKRQLTRSPAKIQSILTPFLSGTAQLFIAEIEGAGAYADGRSDSISGLEAPDDHTLVVHTTRSTGELGFLLSLPTTAPIPAKPDDSGAPLGVATGYDTGYWRFLVGSGPYMVEGSDELDFTLPPAKQQAPKGYVPGRSLVLVRNPSWRPGDDALRPAYVDRIVFRLYGKWDGRTAARVARQIDRGDVDFMFGYFQAGADGSPPEQVRRYQASSALQDRVDVSSVDAVRYVSMNIAVPPFDDVHVRRAVNLAIDKKRVLAACCDPTDEITGHVALDSLENNLLLDYDPYATADHRGNLPAARFEMARSRYDRDHDGRCDARVCKGLFAPVREDTAGRAGGVVRANLARIGLHLSVREYEVGEFYERVLDPRAKVPLSIGFNWTKDFPAASNFFAFFTGGFSGSPTLMGSRPGQLKSWGYRVRSVPSIDPKIRECLPLVGGPAEDCWAETDQLLMEKIVPVAPLYVKTSARVYSARIKDFVVDQFVARPALEQIALRG
jgi:peptide/nickel transport system substrate-binding protein